MILEIPNPKSSARQKRKRQISTSRAGSVSDRFRSWSSGLIVLLLCGYLLFCHGCHGEDIDDELSAPPPSAQNSERPVSAGW